MLSGPQSERRLRPAADTHLCPSIRQACFDPGWLTCMHLSDCSGHGDCFRGACYCHTGWGGSDCSKAICTSACEVRWHCRASCGPDTHSVPSWRPVYSRAIRSTPFRVPQGFCSAPWPALLGVGYQMHSWFACCGGFAMLAIVRRTGPLARYPDSAASLSAARGRQAHVTAAFPAQRWRRTSLQLPRGFHLAQSLPDECEHARDWATRASSPDPAVDLGDGVRMHVRRAACSMHVDLQQSGLAACIRACASALALADW